MLIADEITCRELVELITDYLEGALEEAARARFEQHLVICPNCTAYLDQMRETIRLTGRLPEEALDPRVRDELLQTFRDWKARGALDG